MSEHDVAGLVRALRQGDEQAFNQLVRLYQARIWNLTRTYVKDEEEAKDLTQDIFVTAYRSLGHLRDDAKFGAWLYQLALNHCRNRYKRLKRRGFFSNLSLDDPDNPIPLSQGDTPERQLERRDTAEVVRNAIAAMPETEKEILLLRDLQELSYEEISAILDIPLGTVKSKLNRARLALKDRLKKMLE